MIVDSQLTLFYRVSGGKEVTDIELDAIDTIGTWGHRVLRFKPEHKSSSPTHIPGTPDESELQPRSARTRRRTTRGGPPERRVSIDEEAAAVNAAWRWRFNRRWRTEQVETADISIKHCSKLPHSQSELGV